MQAMSQVFNSFEVMILNTSSTNQILIVTISYNVNYKIFATFE